ncbi:hypothetical protein BV20DRAFT_963601 [Pilatotrama ljubarskyi]|nr:hypothetical protein BV20DRAFT_963601 [Pilatotrama ljubarskyi]
MDIGHNSSALPPPATPARKAPQRSEQPVGRHFTTPQKRRAPRKDATFVSRPDLALRSQRLNADLQALLNTDNAVEPEEDQEDVEMTLEPNEPMESTDCDVTMMDDRADDPTMDPESDLMDPGPAKRAARNRSDALKSVHAAWLSLIPTLLDEYLVYLRSAHGRTTRSPPDWTYSCARVDCVPQSCAIMCLFYDYPITVQVVYCECTSIARMLVRNGLFPTAPTQPRVAVSIDLLEFYMALFERSADAVSALAAALKTFYQRRGFSLLNNKGERVRDPFRRGIGNAIQWYDHLRHRHEAAVDRAVDECLKIVEEAMPLSDSNDLDSRIVDSRVSNPLHSLVNAADGTTPPDMLTTRLDDEEKSCGSPLGRSVGGPSEALIERMRGGSAKGAREESLGGRLGGSSESSSGGSIGGSIGGSGGGLSGGPSEGPHEGPAEGLRRGHREEPRGGSVQVLSRGQAGVQRDGLVGETLHNVPAGGLPEGLPAASRTLGRHEHAGVRGVHKAPDYDVEHAQDHVTMAGAGESFRNRQQHASPDTIMSGPSDTTGPTKDDQSPPVPLVSGKCDFVLQGRCPACFGGSRFGRAFRTDGGDVHVAMDATFSQRHNASAGDNPWHHDPKYFISKEQVDAVGDRIAASRKKVPRHHSSEVPGAALDECQKSFEAADEKKEKTLGKKFDDTGLMALVCRHDVVLFLANVDTPGEQQKYAIALLEHFFSFLPKSATVAAFYDIGCVIDRSVKSYDILPNDIVQRLQFATSVMHAYGHQWACQLVYNPRLREGLGLSEGEGTERVWSKFRKLIGVTRTSGRSRRLWLLDRHAEFVNETSREELGSWICSRLKNGVEARTAAAEQDILQCGASIQELREQWKLQRAAQLSVRQHAPARLKRELDSVLSLQTELDAIEQHFVAIEHSLEAGTNTPIAHEYLSSLRRSHASTLQKVDELYASLNVTDDFPELQNLPLEFVRTLLMARDLKINIRKRAIGSFFEWDKLDRAAGGRDQPLGTKLHQQTRKAIAKRTPALVTAIRKFNRYCDTLEDLYKPEWSFPLPRHLPTELGALRDDSSLLVDVWTTPAAATVPRWLEDSNIRKGIRAMLVKDRCLEERRRLGNEADNLCRWYRHPSVLLQKSERV